MEKRTGNRFGEIAVREGFASRMAVRECLEIQSKLKSFGVEPKRIGPNGGNAEGCKQFANFRNFAGIVTGNDKFAALEAATGRAHSSTAAFCMVTSVSMLWRARRMSSMNASSSNATPSAVA